MTDGFADGFADVSGIPDAESIPDGSVFAVSDSPGYVALTAMIAAGDAQLVADQFLPDRRRLIMASVGRASARNPEPEKLFVTIGSSYFTKAETEYTDWRMAWWREAVQNSYDAKARNIRLDAHEEEGFMVVSCDDDGIGMDLNTIKTKFLALSETTKGTAGDIGGFGKAKEILCFRWPKWELYSRDNFLSGQNGQCERVEQEYRKGTLLRVWMPLENNCYTRADIASSFLSRCHLRNVNMFINGEPWTEGWLYNGKFVRDLHGDKVDAKVYYTKESKRLQAECYVRTSDGLFMHSRSAPRGAKGYIVIELVPKTDPDTGKTYPGITYLSSSRDSITDELSNEVYGFINEVAADLRSSLRGKPKTAPEKFEGAGKFKAQIRQKQADLLYNMQVEVKGDESGLTKASAEAIAKAMLEAAAMNAALLEALLKAKYTGQTHVETALKQIAGTYWKRDFYIYPEESASQFKIPKMFYPDTQTPTIHKLARVWADFCLYAMIALNCDRPFGVGWIFSTEASAAYLQQDEEEWLLLNPYIVSEKALKAMGKVRRDKMGDNPLIDPNDDGHLDYLFSMAIHEVTHMVDGCTRHDEDFTSAFTYNLALAGGGFKQIKRIAKASRAIAREERETPGLETTEMAASYVPDRPILFDMQNLRAELLKFVRGEWDKFTFFEAGAVHGSLFYPELDKTMPSQVAEQLLGRGIPVFMSNLNGDLTLLLPSRRIPIIGIDYTTSATTGWKLAAIKKFGKLYPALLMAAFSNYDATLDAFYNTPVGHTEGYRVNELPYGAVRDIASGIAGLLAQEYDSFVLNYGIDHWMSPRNQQNPDRIHVMFRLMVRYGTDCWTVRDGFSEVFTQQALLTHHIDDEQLGSEQEYLGRACAQLGIPERGYEVLSAAMLPNMAHPIEVIPTLSRGWPCFVHMEDKLVLVTPKLSRYPFPHSKIVDALAHHAGIYRCLILIAQGRLERHLYSELQTDRLVSFKSGEPWKSTDTFKAFLGKATVEMEAALKAGDTYHFAPFGTTAAEVVKILNFVIDGAKDWMERQQ